MNRRHVLAGAGLVAAALIPFEILSARSADSQPVTETTVAAGSPPLPAAPSTIAPDAATGTAPVGSGDDAGVGANRPATTPATTVWWVIGEPDIHIPAPAMAAVIQLPETS